jgi:excisionase family DNA binding protein
MTNADGAVHEDLAAEAAATREPRMKDAAELSRLLVTPEQAAEVLSIGRSKLYELIAAGLLETVRIGSCRRIPMVALTEFVQRLRRLTAEPEPNSET